MEFDLVTLEQAKELKLLGYKQNTALHTIKYNENGLQKTLSEHLQLDNNHVLYDAPNIEEVINWFKNNKNILITINDIYTSFLDKHIYVTNINKIVNGEEIFLFQRPFSNNYKDAVYAGIDKAIEILKNNIL